jgi:hypothetical protein
MCIAHSDHHTTKYVKCLGFENSCPLLVKDYTRTSWAVDLRLIFETRLAASAESVASAVNKTSDLPSSL